MLKRETPSSIVWLVALILLAVAAALVAGVVLYSQQSASTRVRAEAITGGNVDLGRAKIAAYACGACHVIPGIDGAAGKVGPDLTHVAQRPELTGTMRNDPETMVRWLMHPQQAVPHGGMPDQGVREVDARNMAAYLYAQD